MLHGAGEWDITVEKLTSDTASPVHIRWKQPSTLFPLDDVPKHPCRLQFGIASSFPICKCPLWNVTRAHGKKIRVNFTTAQARILCLTRVLNFNCTAICQDGRQIAVEEECFQVSIIVDQNIWINSDNPIVTFPPAVLHQQSTAALARGPFRCACAMLHSSSSSRNGEPFIKRKLRDTGSNT
jgi:hypothetical protein